MGNKLEKEVIQDLEHPDKKKLAHLFDKVDKDKNGYLDEAEYEEFIVKPLQHFLSENPSKFKF